MHSKRIILMTRWTGRGTIMNGWCRREPDDTQETRRDGGSVPARFVSSKLGTDGGRSGRGSRERKSRGRASRDERTVVTREFDVIGLSHAEPLIFVPLSSRRLDGIIIPASSWQPMTRGVSRSLSTLRRCAVANGGVKTRVRRSHEFRNKAGILRQGFASSTT